MVISTASGALLVPRRSGWPCVVFGMGEVAWAGDCWGWPAPVPATGAGGSGTVVCWAVGCGITVGVGADCEPGSSVTVRGSARSSPGETIAQTIGISTAAHFTRTPLSHTPIFCRMLQGLDRDASAAVIWRSRPPGGAATMGRRPRGGAAIAWILGGGVSPAIRVRRLCLRVGSISAVNRRGFARLERNIAGLRIGKNHIIKLPKNSSSDRWTERVESEEFSRLGKGEFPCGLVPS